MTTLRLRQEQAEEIIWLLRNPVGNTQLAQTRATDLEHRLSDGGSTFVCANCGGVFPQRTGRPRKTCSAACRQASFQKKHGRRVTRKKADPWTEQEVETLIGAVGSYYGTQAWVFGQRSLAWQAIASEVGRTVFACHTKYKNLVRQGVVAEWGEMSVTDRVEEKSREEKEQGTEYLVVDSIDMGDLMEQVEVWMSDGWVCQGGVSVAIAVAEHNYFTRYAQAMIRDNDTSWLASDVEEDEE